MFYACNMKGSKAKWANLEKLKFLFMKPQHSKVDFRQFGHLIHLPELCGILIRKNHVKSNIFDPMKVESITIYRTKISVPAVFPLPDMMF